MANTIYFDLYKTKYVFRFNPNIYFYFSSPVYLEKFRKRINEYLKNEKNKFSYRYKFNEIDDLFFYLVLYNKIETRGFLVKCGDIYYNSIDTFRIGLFA